MKEEDSLKGLLAIIKQRLVMIISFGILGLLLTAVYTFFIVTPMYESTTQLLVNRANGDASNGIQLNDINSNVQMINTFKDIIKGPVILEEVKEQLEIDYTVEQLAAMVAVDANEDSQVFSLIVRGPNAGEAAEIANEIAVTFQSAIVDIMNVENVSIISTAAINSHPISPVILNNLLIGMVLGLLFGLGFTFLRYAMVRTIDDYQFITQTIGWPKLGIVSELNKEELTAISEMRKGEVTTVPEVRKRERIGETEILKTERISEPVMLKTEPVAIQEKKREAPVDIVGKRKKKIESASGMHRERLVTVSEMTREKIVAILQSDAGQSADIGNERRK